MERSFKNETLSFTEKINKEVENLSEEEKEFFGI